METSYSNNTNRTGLPPFVHYLPDPVVVKVFKTLALLAIIATSLLCNTLVIHVARTSRRMKNSTNRFIINMAASDLLMTVFCMPPTVQAAIKGPFIMDFRGTLGIIVCKLVTFLQGVSVYVSVLTLLAISVDRFLAIVFPFTRLVNLRVAHIIIGAVWFVSMAITAPLLYSVRLYERGRFSICIEKWSPLFCENANIEYSTFVFFGLYVIPLAGIGILYSAIAFELWKGSVHHADQKTTRRENRAVIGMLVAIVVGFGLCWLPYQVRIAFLVFEPKRFEDLPGTFSFAALYLGYANSALNPIILVVFNKNYRQGIWNVLVSRFHVANHSVGPNIRTEALQTVHYRSNMESVRIREAQL